ERRVGVEVATPAPPCRPGRTPGGIHLNPAGENGLREPVGKPLLRALARVRRSVGQPLPQRRSSVSGGSPTWRLPPMEGPGSPGRPPSTRGAGRLDAGRRHDGTSGGIMIGLRAAL